MKSKRGRQGSLNAILRVDGTSQVVTEQGRIRAARIIRSCVLAVFGILIVFDVIWTVAEATRGRIGYAIVGVVFLVIQCVISFAVYKGTGNVRPVG